MDDNTILNNQTKTIYNDINTLENSLLENASKANELRKIYEKFFKYLLDYNSNETRHTLHNMINDYLIKENKYSLQYICHSLRKDLNSWAHDNPSKLLDETLYCYFHKFRNIVYSLTNIDDIKENGTKNFDLSNFNLNNKQEKSVLSNNKITLVNAGPGSGKTYLIVARVLNEINKNNDKKIFALSFTNKASDELQHKIDEKIFSTNLSIFRKNIFTGTIHSFVLETIQEYFKINNRTFDYTVIDDFELKEIKEEFENHDELVAKYLQDNQLLTFDNIISMFINTIKNNVKFQEFITKHLDEIIIDEAQDLDKPQYEILSLLDKYIKNLKLFFVGDQRQNIYAFKGGSIHNILEFFGDEKDFSHIELEYSYRCPQNTLSFINKFEFNDCKNISLKNALNNNGNELKIEEFESMEDEANWIAKLINNTSNRKSFSDIAIIYSNTFYFKNILESLNAFEIPFKVMGGQYFLNKDIRLIRYILNSIYTKNKFALKNIQNILIKTEFNGENIDEILVPLLDIDIKGKQNYLSLREILKFIKGNLNTDKSILSILAELNILIESKNLMNKDFTDVLFELKEIIQNDLTLDMYEKFKLSFSPMHPKLNIFYSRSDEIVLSEYYDESKEFVTVTTIHSAKGLEWDTVIIPGMSQDSFPRYFKLEQDREKEIPNELKKFYVACSRTRRELYFTRAKYNNWGYKKDRSIFLKNI